MSKILLFILTILCLAALVFNTIFKQRIVRSNVAEQFVVNRPYRAVVLSLSRLDSLEKIVSANQGTVFARTWDRLNFELHRINKPDWKIDGVGRFSVTSNDPHLGDMELDFVQQIYANPNEMIIETMLIRPCNSLQERSTFISIKKEGNQTRFSIRSVLKIKRRHPPSWQKHVQQVVDDINYQSMKNTASCLKELAESRGVFTLRR